MPNVNLTQPAPSSGLPIAVQQAQAAQMQALAQALMAQSTQAGDAVIHTGGGNQFARDVPNFGDPIARIAKAFLGQRQSDEATTRQGSLAQQYQDTLSHDMAGITSAMSPTEQPGIGPPSPDGTPAQGLTAPPDIAGAIKQGSASQIPEVRGVAEALMKQQIAGIPTGKDYLNYGNNYSPEGMKRFRDTGGTDPSLLTGRAKAEIQNGVLTTLQDGKKIGAPVATETFKPPAKDEGTGVPVQESEVTGKVNPLYGGNATPVNVRENELSKADVKQLETGRDEYKQSITSLGNLVAAQNRLKQIPDSKFGTLAEFRNWANKTTELFGGKQLPATSNMEALHTAVGNSLIEKVRALAPVTEEDVKIMKDIVGTEGNTKRALDSIIQVAIQGPLRKMGQHEQFVNAFAQQPGIDPGFKDRWVPGFSVGGDSSVPGASPKTMNWDELK